VATGGPPCSRERAGFIARGPKIHATLVEVEVEDSPAEPVPSPLELTVRAGTPKLIPE